MMITLPQAKVYVKADYVDCIEEDRYIDFLIEVSEIYIDMMVGEGYKQNEKAVKLAELVRYKLINDMYEQRSTEVTEKSKNDRLTNSILDKLSNYQ